METQTKLTLQQILEMSGHEIERGVHIDQVKALPLDQLENYVDSLPNRVEVREHANIYLSSGQFCERFKIGYYAQNGEDVAIVDFLAALQIQKGVNPYFLLRNGDQSKSM
ncbi:hypothetical protein KY311_00115 [Candidatus Woesearchaeota archaeon]|nr:hypothetical protein [Candidatus Woesearchaeota archaeon]MBW3017270.1 hypothetical protein [Candidatus Woesearchaeota archaeon]